MFLAAGINISLLEAHNFPLRSKQHKYAKLYFPQLQIKGSRSATILVPNP
jgi:hypothetical protein